MCENKTLANKHQTKVNIWKKDFVLAIKNNDEIQLDKLLDESDEYFQGYILTSNIDFNVLKDDTLSAKEKGSKIRKLLQEDLEDMKKQILKQSRDNVKYILKLLHDDEKNDFINKCGEEQIYANANFTKICETPILLNIFYPFELSGIFIFCLLHENVEFKVPPALFNINSPLNSDSHNYYEGADEYFYKYGVFFGKSKEKAKHSYAFQLKKLLNFDVKNWNTNKYSDTWSLLEMLYYVDRSCYKAISKSHGIKPLFHIIDDNEYYWQTLNEFINGLNPYSIKYLIFKTLVFFNVVKSESCLDLPFIVADFLDGDSNITNMLNSCWLIPYVMTKDSQDFDKIIKYHKKLVNDINLNIDQVLIEDNKYENLFKECLWKLILYDQICNKRIRRSFIQFINSHTLEQYKSIQNMMLPIGKHLVSLNDWHDFYNEYEDNLKNIFSNLDEKNLKDLWKVACKNLLFVFPKIFGFNFKENRLSQNRIKNFFQKEYNGVKVEAINLLVLMEIANIGKSLTGDISNKTEKSAPQNNLNFVIPLRRFGKNPPSYSIFKVMDNIHRYSSDAIIIFLREISNILAVSYIVPYDYIKLLLNAYNTIMKSYEIIFASEFCMKQSIKVLLNYQNKVIMAESNILLPFITED